MKKKKEIEATLIYQGKSVDMEDKKATENLVGEMVNNVIGEKKVEKPILTETRYLKYEFTDKELLDISRKGARASGEISVRMDELKSVTTSIKAQIAEQEGIVNACSEKIRSGYEMRPVECVITYQGADIIFTNSETGEEVEKRPMTKDEQLRMSGKVVDAEKIIREDREKLVNKDGEADD